MKKPIRKPKTNSDPNHLRNVYAKYRENFEAATDIALINPVLRDDSPEKAAQIDGNKVLVVVEGNFRILCMVSIHQKKFEDEWYWRAVVYMLTPRTGKRHQRSLWTRRQRLAMKNFGLAYFVGVGEANEGVRQGEEGSMFIFTKDASRRDVEVVEAVLSGQKVESKEATVRESGGMEDREASIAE